MFYPIFKVQGLRHERTLMRLTFDHGTTEFSDPGCRGPGCRGRTGMPWPYRDAMAVLGLGHRTGTVTPHRDWDTASCQLGHCLMPTGTLPHASCQLGHCLMPHATWDTASCHMGHCLMGHCLMVHWDTASRYTGTLPHGPSGMASWTFRHGLMDP